MRESWLVIGQLAPMLMQVILFRLERKTKLGQIAVVKRSLNLHCDRLRLLLQLGLSATGARESFLRPMFTYLCTALLSHPIPHFGRRSESRQQVLRSKDLEECLPLATGELSESVVLHHANI